MKRVVFRSETLGEGEGSGGLPQDAHAARAGERLGSEVRQPHRRADIKADLDNTFDMVREQFGYKRKDLDVSAERDGIGFIRTPDFEYTVSVSVNPDEPTDVIWRREIGRLTRAGVRALGGVPRRLRHDVRPAGVRVRVPVDVADFVDRIEDAPPEGVKVGVASDANEAEIALAGFAGQVTVTPDAVTIHGRAGNPASLLEQFLAFLRKFAGLGEPKALTS